MGNKPSVNKKSLADACRIGDVDLVLQAIVNGEANYNEGLYMACKYGKSSVLPILYDCNAIITDTMLILATLHGHLNILQYVYSKQPAILSRAEIDIYACLCNHVDIVQWLINMGRLTNIMKCIYATDRCELRKRYNDHYVAKLSSGYGDQFIECPISLTDDFKKYANTGIKTNIARLILTNYPNIYLENSLSPSLTATLLNDGFINNVKKGDTYENIKQVTFKKKITLKYTILHYKIKGLDEQNIIPIIMDYVMFDNVQFRKDVD